MAGLQDLLEAYKNYRGVQDWKLGQQMNRVPGAEEAMDLWGGWDTGGLAGAIKAYHGSPRPEPFTRFDSAYMGSGEGAQAFGKGHYLAERPGIAKAYAEMRGKMYEKQRTFDPKFLDKFKQLNLLEMAQRKEINDPWIRAAIEENASDPHAKILSWYHDLEDKANKGSGPHKQSAIARMKDLSNIYPDLNKIKPRTITSGPLRSLYEVSLEWPGARESVDPMSREHFFQWDKEFRSQPKNIREALMDIAEQYPAIIEPYAEWLAKHNSPGHTPESLMKMHPQATIKALEGGVEPLMYERGIPGIAFLDQPSRIKKVGDRTYNYVAFGDEIPRIISHNKPSVLDMLWPKK